MNRIQKHQLKKRKEMSIPFTKVKKFELIIILSYFIYQKVTEILSSGGKLDLNLPVVFLVFMHADYGSHLSDKKHHKLSVCSYKFCSSNSD